MQDNTSISPVSIYTDFQGLNQLKHGVNISAADAKKEVGQQFESLLIQMLLKSMREANNTFKSELSSSDQQGFYEDLYDKQLSLVLSKSGVGLSGIIEQGLNQVMPQTPVNSPVLKTQTLPIKEVAPPSEKTPASSKSAFNSAEDFITHLWHSAKAASTILGADPKLLLAQAALETNWGKHIIDHLNGASSHNLFNIKADTSWQKERVSKEAVEYKDGFLVKENSKFRSYGSYEESFHDFIHFLQNNDRYKTALTYANSPEKFAHALQEANYATDKQYADKILSIYHSKKLEDVIATYHLS